MDAEVVSCERPDSTSARKCWGERRGLNPRPSVPQTDALPAELRSPKPDDCIDYTSIAASSTIGLVGLFVTTLETFAISCGWNSARWCLYRSTLFSLPCPIHALMVCIGTSDSTNTVARPCRKPYIPFFAIPSLAKSGWRSSLSAILFSSGVPVTSPTKPTQCHLRSVNKKDNSQDDPHDCNYPISVRSNHPRKHVRGPAPLRLLSNRGKHLKVQIGNHGEANSRYGKTNCLRDL
jgi:hypothetical protein